MNEYRFDASNYLVGEVWKGTYRGINRANLVITTLPEKTEALGEDLANRLVAEAKFFRAFHYFDLVSMWGVVPLITEPLGTVEGVGLAGSENEIYELILSDLEEAARLLPRAPQYGGADIGRASAGAAEALTARVELYRGNYQAAKTALDKVIGSGDYALVDSYVDNHREDNENNKESIFEVQFSLEAGIGDGWSGDGNGLKEVSVRAQEYSPVDWHNVVPSDALLNAYEPGDPRFDYNFLTYGETYNNGQLVFTSASIAQGTRARDNHWYKYGNLYKKPNELFWSGINMRVIRYADVLLMKAEVENELNGPAAALPFINQVRQRPSVNVPSLPTTAYPTGSKEEMFRAIVHERQVELCSEQVRVRDIKRWVNNGKLATNPLGNIDSRYNYLPIPIFEIDNNPDLTNSDQKPGF